MDDELRAGIAIYNAGRYHAAHDAWEQHWLELDAGTDDERLLHGLIQFTAAIHHARNRNWVGAQGLAESARGYLDGLPADYRGLDLDAVRTALVALGADPEWIERSPVPVLTHEGRALALDDLDFESAAVVARVFAHESEAMDESVVEAGIERARADLADGWETSPLVALVLDIAREEEHRELAFDRLRQHVARERRRDEDVGGLFEEGDR